MTRTAFPSAPALTLLALCQGCAHAPDGGEATKALAPVEWPAPPAIPRVRLAGIITAAAPPADARPWWRRALAAIVGTEESDPRTGELLSPFGVAFEATGGFVVSDSVARAVYRYAADGAFVGRVSCAELDFEAPMDVAVGVDGSILIADGGLAAVVRWTAAGCTRIGDAALQRPTGVAASNGTIFVADPPAHQIVAFSSKGAVLARFGARGSGEGQFNFPTALALGADGTLWVVDALNFRIVHLAPDGRWLGSFGSPGESGAGLARPKGIHVDARGRIFVSDAQRDVVIVFASDGTEDFSLGATGSDAGRFSHPAGIDIRRSRLLVADSQNRRVQIFEILGEST